MTLAQMRAANYTAKLAIEDFGIPDIEQHRNNYTGNSKKPNWLWCTYTKGFVKVDKFSDAQKLTIFKDRYCMDYSNSVQRAKRQPSVDLLESETLRMAKIMKVVLTRGGELIEGKKSHPWPSHFCAWQYTGKHTEKHGKQVTPCGGNVRYDADDLHDSGHAKYYTLEDECVTGGQLNLKIVSSVDGSTHMVPCGEVYALINTYEEYEVANTVGDEGDEVEEVGQPGAAGPSGLTAGKPKSSRELQQLKRPSSVPAAAKPRGKKARKKESKKKYSFGDDEADALITEHVIDHLVTYDASQLIPYDPSLQRDPGNKTLKTRSEGDPVTGDGDFGTDLVWFTSLDDGIPSEDRKAAAAADIKQIDDMLAKVESKDEAYFWDMIQEDDRFDDLVFEPRTYAILKRRLTRTKLRVEKIANGKPGFARLSRSAFRSAGGNKLIIDGTEKTCQPDALIAVARYLKPDFQIVQKDVYNALLTASGEPNEFAFVVCYAREKLGLRVDEMTTGAHTLTRMPGGTAFQVMQLPADYTVAYILIVHAKVGVGEMSTTEKHCIAYLPAVYVSSKPTCRGALVDNDTRINVLMVDDNDRTIDGARKLFDSLFPTAVEVRIRGVYRFALPPDMPEAE